MAKYIYNHKKDPHDLRDFKFKIVHAPTETIPLPERISLRSKFIESPYDQGQLGSCSAQAGAGVFTFVHQGGPWSRLAIYYFERKLEGTINEDSGAFLRDCIKVLSTVGVGLEKDWAYDIAKFQIEPPPIELSEASTNKIVVYSRLDIEDKDFKTCLAQGFPFMVGIQVFEGLESEQTAETGIVELPSVFDTSLGGHAVVCIGYDDNFRNSGKKYYEMRNSWGTNWGDGGYFWLPAEYLENPNYASDAWTIRK